MTHSRRLPALALLTVLVMLTAGCTGGDDDDDDGADTGPGGPADGLLLKGWVHVGAQSLELRNRGNETIFWDDYRVTLNGTRVHPEDNVSSPKENSTFDYGGGRLAYYTEYEVRVVENATRTVVWERELVSTL